MSLNLTNKNIFKWIAISGICGILSLIFDQLSIQQETEIRNASELTQEAVNEQIYIANINQSILDFQRTLNIFTDNSAITYIYLSKLNTNLWDLYSSGKDYQIAQAEMLQLKSLFEKNIRSFINNTTDFFKENKFYYTQLRLLNDESNQVLDSIINKDYYLNQTWVISSDSESMADEISFYSVLEKIKTSYFIFHC